MKVMCGMKILLTSEEKNGIVRIGAATRNVIKVSTLRGRNFFLKDF